jgi:hypothetical protein
MPDFLTKSRQVEALDQGEEPEASRFRSGAGSSPALKLTALALPRQ